MTTEINHCAINDSSVDVFGNFLWLESIDVYEPDGRYDKVYIHTMFTNFVRKAVYLTLNTDGDTYDIPLDKL